jgi:hypothetical protein
MGIKLRSPSTVGSPNSFFKKKHQEEFHDEHLGFRLCSFNIFTNMTSNIEDTGVPDLISTRRPVVVFFIWKWEVTRIFHSSFSFGKE